MSFEETTTTEPASTTNEESTNNEESDIIEAPYGSWESPITSKSITTSSVKLSSISFVNGNLYWLEGRPQEGGRYVLCRYDASSSSTTNNNNRIDVTPKDSNVRTRVHEYGGGSFIIQKNNTIYYSEFQTQQLCQLQPKNNNNDTEPIPKPITPTPPEGGSHIYRFADGVISPLSTDTTTIIFSIRENHSDPKNIKNEIVQLELDQSDNNNNNNNSEAKITVIATGNDFYAAPRLSPDGTQLAYITWNFPNMPWDATELRVVTVAQSSSDNTLSSSSSLLLFDPNSSTHELIAGHDGDTSIIQPLWHGTKGNLYYISDESGYYNIYLYNKNEDKPTTCILPMNYDFGGSMPGWHLGQQGYQFLSDSGTLVTSYNRNGKSVLLIATIDHDNSGTVTYIQEYTSHQSQRMNDDEDHNEAVVPTNNALPMQFGHIIEGDNSDLYFIGASPSTAASIYKWNLQTPTKPAEILISSSTLTFPNDVISTPTQIEFPTGRNQEEDVNETAFAYYYPPCNGKYICTTELDGPPLLVKAHGGPTACTGTAFNAGIQFWTSRGFGVVDVDYSGSTGYGRDYRRRLNLSWGIVDVNDVCAAAQYLAHHGLADGKRLCIDGGSAGGYTTLAALAFRNDVFKAGCSLYGIGDLTALAGDTHKFESRYLDRLIGPYPQQEELYKQRSPINSVDTLSCPILLLQGSEDKIVPPNQAKMMHTALLKKGIPTCLKIYDNEQHGFRKAENIEDALDSELAFYGRVFGINIPNSIDIEIDNM